MDREPVIAPALVAEAIVAIGIIAAIAWNLASIAERLETRNKIAWPTEEHRISLQAEIRAAIEFLKR